MIKLTVNPEKENDIYNFEKTEIIIGSKFSSYADLRLSTESLEDIHVKISTQNEGCYAYNIANDPFTTINNLPFGKLLIKDGDSIQIGNTLLFFELAKKNEESKKSNLTEIKQDENLSKQIWENEIEDDELQKMLSFLKKPQENVEYKSEFTKDAFEGKQLESEIDLNPFPSKSPRSVSSFRKIKIFIFSLIIILTAIFFISNEIFSRIEEKSAYAEIEAAKAVADVALALTYVQINHLQLRQHNWADPYFLKNSMDAVISNYYEPYASVDINSRLNNGDYMLRIYTNRDVSRFLVIAQPEPSLMHWISPKNAVVIDSQSMMLHSIRDLKSLNRLLVNSNSLSGENGREILDLVKTEKIIPLKQLVDPEKKNGFDVPKQLEFIRSGSENYVYNAPRYSQIGERLIEQAIDLSSRPSGNFETKKLQEDIDAIAKLPNVILYTTKGMKVALKGQKALSELAPYNQFLFAYFHFNNEGEIKGSYLLLDPADSLATKSIGQVTFQKQSDTGSYRQFILPNKNKDYSLNQVHSKEKKKNNSFLDTEKDFLDPEETFTSISKTNDTDNEIEAHFKSFLDSIATSNDFEDLYKLTSSSSKFLRLENIPNSSILIEYQNKLRTQVQEKLKEILSNSQNLATQIESIKKNKELLSKILLQSWILNPEDQKEFFEGLNRLYSR